MSTFVKNPIFPNETVKNPFLSFVFFVLWRHLCERIFSWLKVGGFSRISDFSSQPDRVIYPQRFSFTKTKGRRGISESWNFSYLKFALKEKTLRGRRVVRSREDGLLITELLGLPYSHLWEVKHAQKCNHRDIWERGSERGKKIIGSENMRKGERAREEEINDFGMTGLAWVFPALSRSLVLGAAQYTV